MSGEERTLTAVISQAFSRFRGQSSARFNLSNASKKLQAIFSKRYSPVASYLDSLFSVYDKGQTGVITRDMLSKMLRDFHGSFGVNVDVQDEMQIADSFISLCTKKCCLSQRTHVGCGSTGISKECFQDILQSWLQLDLDHEYENNKELRNGASVQFRRMQHAVQWIAVLSLVLLFAALITWIMISPNYKHAVSWSLFSGEIIVAKAGAGLAVSGTFFCLLFVNKYFVQILLSQICSYFHMRMSIISMHKAFASIILVGGVMHTIAWFVLYGKVGDSKAQYGIDSSSLLSRRSVSGLYTSYASITGYVLIGILMLGYATASKSILHVLRFLPACLTKALNRYSVYYWSHIFMAVSFVTILLLHPLPGLPSLDELNGSIAWVFLALPCLLFIVQFVHKAFSRLHQRSHIIESQILPGGVTRIVFPRPKSMGACKAGQYVEITIHAISHVEVHPFSLSGCPGDGMLQLHIKDLGDWTHRLYELASENRLNGQTIYVMGPFVTRAYEFMKYSNILLVGAGIGATPFVSIIENILKTDQSKKKRVHFHWLVNDQQAAKSWFPGLLQAVEDYSGDQQIMASVWYTGGRVFSSSIEKRLFEFSEKLLWDKNGRDFVMGIQKKNHRVKVNFGRPTWDDVLFEQTSGADEEPIGVFCCGPDGLTNSLEIACMEQSTLKQPINFHAEHFNSW